MAISARGPLTSAPPRLGPRFSFVFSVYPLVPRGSWLPLPCKSATSPTRTSLGLLFPYTAIVPAALRPLSSLHFLERPGKFSPPRQTDIGRQHFREKWFIGLHRGCRICLVGCLVKQWLALQRLSLPSRAPRSLRPTSFLSR